MYTHLIFRWECSGCICEDATAVGGWPRSEHSTVQDLGEDSGLGDRCGSLFVADGRWKCSRPGSIKSALPSPPTWPTYAMYCLLFRNFESPASLCSPQKRRKTTIQWWLFSVWLLFFFFSVGYTHTLKSHHCMVVVVFLLFCGLHNEAGDSKFRKGDT